MDGVLDASPDSAASAPHPPQSREAPRSSRTDAGQRSVSRSPNASATAAAPPCDITIV